MPIDYDKLINKLPKDQWITRQELDALWKVKPPQRKSWINSLAKQGRIVTRGKTAQIQYHVSNKKNKVKVVPSQGYTATSLDRLVHAASALGSENAIQKKALEEIKTIVEKALEVRT